MYIFVWLLLVMHANWRARVAKPVVSRDDRYDFDDDEDMWFVGSS